jgi:hypothetical protein
MADDPLPPSESPGHVRRFWWLLLGVLLFLVCFALIALTGSGKHLLSLVGAVPAGTEELTSEPVLATMTTLPDVATSTSTSEPTGEATEATMAPTDELTQEPTQQIVSFPPDVGNGGCFAACDPANSNCHASLACVPGASSTGYVCWGLAICQTEVPTPNMVCNPGQWTGCGGLPPSIVCPWNSVSQCQPDGTWGACIWDPSTCEPCSVAVCGDGKCAAGCESSSSCPADCGSGGLVCPGGSPSNSCICHCYPPNEVICSDGNTTVPDTNDYCTDWCVENPPEC